MVRSVGCSTPWVWMVRSASLSRADRRSCHRQLLPMRLAVVLRQVRVRGIERRHRSNWEARMKVIANSLITQGPSRLPLTTMRMLLGHSS